VFVRIGVRYTEAEAIARRGPSYVKVGAKYGVSDNAVRKWLRGYETPPKGGS